MSNVGSLPTFPFNVDLTDCLLMALPDFRSLQVFIVSSKFVYSVFRSRQNSVLCAVAQNQLGPALPLAMNLVKCIGGTPFSVLSHDLYREESGFSQDLGIVPTEVRFLQGHSDIVRALEDIYSWREKDPRTQYSRLSVAESLRFQQSVYRFWILAAMYGPGALVDERLECDNADYLRLRESIVTKQINFLSRLGEIELLGVNEVHRFLLDLSKWALVKHTRRLTRRFGNKDDVYLVWSGPAIILDALHGKWPSFRPVDSQWYGTWQAMTHTFFATEIVSVSGEGLPLTTRKRFVLDDYFFNDIKCSQCSGLRPLSRKESSLWSFHNWEYMILVISPSHLSSFLEFDKRRPTECLVSLAEAIMSTPYPQLVEEIFDVRSKKYKDWKKNDWLCTHCITHLLLDSIWAWFDQRIMKKEAKS